MTNRSAGTWLEAVLVGAQDAGWCMTPYCTTCGCLEFRLAYWDAAAKQAGLANQFKSARHPRDILAGVTSAEREALVRALVAGLRNLPGVWTNSKAFRTIVIDLDPPLILHGVPLVLAAELSGTPAGETLARMHEIASEARAQGERRRADESPEAVENRKRDKREKAAIAHDRRQAETRRRNADRLDVLAALARLTPTERLLRFATDAALNLDCVSSELIPAQERDLVDLERTQALDLLARIGRRKGAWGRLRRMLEHLVVGPEQHISPPGQPPQGGNDHGAS